MSLAHWPSRDRWTWDEAFHRDGFQAGNIHSEDVEAVLREAGCTNVFIKWGGSRTNHYIAGLTLPDGARLAFDGRTVDPSAVLPAEIVDALTARFGPPGESLDWK
jgi:hypothetical protein